MEQAHTVRMADAGGWRLGQRPSLDGLRAFAVALVLLCHGRVPGTRELGGVGVTVFFTLSGFLITALLLEQHHDGGRLSIRDFYVRRFRRLMPALVVCVALAVAAEAFVVGAVDWRMPFASLTYTSNLYVPTLGTWTGTPLDHTWSLAVEEQFYLLWPFAMLGVAALRRRLALLLLPYAILASVTFRLFSYEPGVIGHDYTSLPARADELLIGAWLALAISGGPRMRVSTLWLPPLLVGIVAAAYYVPGLLVPTAVALLTAGVLFVCAHSRVGLLEFSWAVWLGRRSYGVYLYQMPILWVLRAEWGVPWWVIALVGSTLTLCLAAVSFRFEDRIRRGGRPSAHVPVHVPAAALP